MTHFGGLDLCHSVWYYADLEDLWNEKGGANQYHKYYKSTKYHILYGRASTAI